MNKIRKLTILISLCALGATAYLVRKGDTLWDLSGQFLSDPFVWPDLWQKNPHVQDPHWIYPGDSLCVPGLDSLCTGELNRDSQTPPPVQATNPCPAGSQQDTVAKGVKRNCTPVANREADFQSQLGSLKNRAGEKETAHGDSTVYIFNKREAPKMFNIYYQRLSPRLIPLEVLKNESQWSTVQSGEKKAPILHSLEHELVLGYGTTTQKNLKVGDLAEIWMAEKKEIKSLKENSNPEYALLRLAAYARIHAVGDSFCRASIVQSFRQLEIQHAKSRPYQALASIQVSGFKPLQEVKLADMGHIVLAMDAGLVIGQYAYVMVDKGAAAGFTAGSGVAFWEEDKTDPKLPPRLLGKGIVARAGKDESAILVRELYSHQRRLALGHKVSLTHSPILK